MRLLFSVYSALILMSWYAEPTYAQLLTSPSSDESPALHRQYPRLRTVLVTDKTRLEPSKEPRRDSESRPARDIKKFTEPTIVLKGTAEAIGLESRTLASLLGRTLLEDFAFLQSDYAFDRTYETWEIGLFECEAWTVGSTYPIAFHVQCAAGSMDEPRHWRYATLGYGPKDKIVDMVRNTLETIVAEYAAFVRKAGATKES
jgi:hypothetical protein